MKILLAMGLLVLNPALVKAMHNNPTEAELDLMGIYKIGVLSPKDSLKLIKSFIEVGNFDEFKQAEVQLKELEYLDIADLIGCAAHKLHLIQIAQDLILQDIWPSFSMVIEQVQKEGNARASKENKKRKKKQKKLNAQGINCSVGGPGCYYYMEQYLVEKFEKLQTQEINTLSSRDKALLFINKIPLYCATSDLLKDIVEKSLEKANRSVSEYYYYQQPTAEHIVELRSYHIKKNIEEEQSATAQMKNVLEKQLETFDVGEFKGTEDGWYGRIITKTKKSE